MKPLFQISSLVIIILLVMMTVNKIQVFASSGSMIGPVDVSGMSKKEMVKEVRGLVAVWQSKEIAIQAGAEEVSVPGTAFDFDVSRSVERLQNAQKRSWYNFWSPKPDVKSDLIVHATEQLRTAMEPLVGTEIDEEIDSLLEQAATLPVRPLKVVQSDFELEEGQIISSITLPIKSNNLNELTQIVDQLDEMLLEPQAEFSFFHTVGKSFKAKNANLVATALYNNALQSGFEVSQRHQASQVQSYIEAGYEAAVNAEKSQDLVFKSTREGLVKLSAKLKNNELLLDFYVPKNEELPNITLYTDDEQTIAPRVIYRYSDDLIEGESEEIRPSKDGFSISVYRKITSLENGTEKKLISSNYYAPNHQIILKSMEETSEEDTNLDENLTDEAFSFEDDPNAALGDDLTNDSYSEDTEVEVVDEGATGSNIINEENGQLLDRDKLVIVKIENPTKEELEDENLIYSEVDDSYYYVSTVEIKAKGEK